MKKQKLSNRPGSGLTLVKKVITSLDNQSQTALRGGVQFVGGTSRETRCGPTYNAFCYSGTGYTCFDSENCC